MMVLLDRLEYPSISTTCLFSGVCVTCSVDVSQEEEECVV